MKENQENSWLEKITLAGDLPTPFLLTDLSIVRRQVETLSKLIPRAGIYYAIKSNNDLRLIKEIDDLVAGFDIASAGEFELLNKAKVSPTRILYSNPVKIPDHIAKTYKSGVRYYALDSADEIKKLELNAPGSTVYLRLKSPDYGSKFPLSSKFGMDPLHAMACASLAEEAGLKVEGLTFHVGSQSENAAAWEAAIKMCGSLIEELAMKEINIKFVNLGGGLPAEYEDVAPKVTEAAKVINEAIEAHLPSHIRLMIEPGRYISANASVLVTSIIGREHRTGTDWLYLDMGVFQGLIEPLEIPGWKYPIFTDKSRRGYKKSYVLTGPTCDAYDTLGSDYLLPSELNVGDRLYIGAAGAYTLVYGSSFNGFEAPKTYYVESEKK